MTWEILKIFGEINTEPTWLNHGVFEFAPTPERDSWIFVTSGCSNPWHVEPEDYDVADETGAGIEFLLETDRQGDWAIMTLLRMLAFDLVLASGQMPGRNPLGWNDRIPLRSAIDGSETATIRNLMMIPSRFEDVRLPSGRFRFGQFIGLTDEEYASKDSGLLARLEQAGATPVLVPDRQSVI